MVQERRDKPLWRSHVHNVSSVFPLWKWDLLVIPPVCGSQALWFASKEEIRKKGETITLQWTIWQIPLVDSHVIEIIITSCVMGIYVLPHMMWRGGFFISMIFFPKPITSVWSSENHHKKPNWGPFYKIPNKYSLKLSVMKNKTILTLCHRSEGTRRHGD